MQYTFFFLLMKFFGRIIEPHVNRTESHTIPYTWLHGHCLGNKQNHCCLLFGKHFVTCFCCFSTRNKQQLLLLLITSNHILWVSGVLCSLIM